ncbi:MAG TPA: fatty acid desaturase [Sphingomonas sp.]|nr:fatty acid desaturase [Sphingomonas sp.]
MKWLDGGAVRRAAPSMPKNMPGLLLAAGIGTLWLAIHVGAIFLWSVAVRDVPLVIGAILLQAWLSTGLFIVAHDCMHGSLLPGRPRANAAVGTAFLAAYAGLSYAALLPKHHAHHAAPGTADDPDFHPDRPRDAVAWFVRFFSGYYTHGQIGRITAAAIVYMLLGASLLNIVLFWAVPALLALVQLFVFGTYLPHRHADTPFADAHRARSTTTTPALSLLTCFHFGGYHHEHHLSPGTPWWRLPTLRRPAAARRQMQR